jgi:hypothetical protein
MAREPDWSRKRWNEEDERWARMSVNRDLGRPLNYNEATGTCEGEEVCGEGAWLRRPEEVRDRPRYPRIFDPAEMDFERSRFRFEAAKGAVGGERGYGYERRPRRSREETRERPYEMDRFMGLWMDRGRYSGVGPRGYRRSDERIREDVCEVLTQDGWVDARDIEVRIKDGEVTLNGTVPERSMKRRAEDAVIKVTGVRDVRNHLDVAETGQMRASTSETQPGERKFAESREGAGYGPGREEPQAGRAQKQAGVQTGFAETETVASSTPRQPRVRVREGMDVIDAKGNFVGRIKAVRENDFLVDRSLARDLYIPNTTLKSAENQVVLNVDEDQLESMDLPKPPLF